MVIKVPNPYEQNVAIGPTNGLGGLHEMPKTKYSMVNSVSKVTNTFKQTVDKWQNEIDTTNAKDAINQTNSQLNDLENNPETGWANQKGENALKRPEGKSLVDEYNEKAKQIIDAQRSSLKTTRARAMFDKYAQSAYLQNSNRLQNHLITQQQVRDKAVSAATIEGADASIRSGDVEQMRSGFVILESELQNIANKTGLPVDRYKMVGSRHLMDIENFIDAKQPDAAQAWFSANKDSMSPEQQRQAKELIKAGKTTARADELSSKMIQAYGHSLSLLLTKVNEIEDEELRKKTEFRVNKQLAATDKIKRAALKEVVDQYWGIVDNGDEPPDTLVAKIKELDPATYREIQHARPKESEEKAVDELTDLLTYETAKFAELDLNEYAARLTKADQKNYQKLQNKLGDASFKDFKNTLILRMGADKAFRNKDIQKQVLFAAVELWDEAKQSYAKGYIDKNTSNQIIDRLLGKDKAFWSKRGYQIIRDRKEGQSAGQALAAADFKDDATDQELNEVLRRNGVNQKVTQQQALYARQIANGYGLDQKIMQQAYESSREACNARGTKLTQEIINRTAEKIAFGQK